MQYKGMILHCGGEPVTFEELGGIELPQQTKSYMPIGHQDLVRMLEHRVQRELDYDGEFDWTHATNKKGSQYFGSVTLPQFRLTDDQALQIVARNSYDMSMSAGFAGGSKTFICDNLALWGNLIYFLRKHTPNIFRDLKRLFVEGLEGLVEKAAINARLTENWKRHAFSNDDGYEAIGLMRGRGLITPTMTNVMFKEWQKPSHEEFKDRNVFSLYNCATEALKGVTPQRAFQRYSGVHDFFREEIIDVEFETVTETREEAYAA
jgi:hypothetical protein